MSRQDFQVGVNDPGTDPSIHPVFKKRPQLGDNILRRVRNGGGLGSQLQGKIVARHHGNIPSNPDSAMAAERIKNRKQDIRHNYGGRRVLEKTAESLIQNGIRYRIAEQYPILLNPESMFGKNTVKIKQTIMSDGPQKNIAGLQADITDPCMSEMK